MKTPLLLSLVTLSLRFLTALGLAAPEKVVVWNNPVEFTEPGLTHHQFASEALKQTVGFSVWLPPEYESSTAHYPVIYFLHGSGGTESADAPDFSHRVAERVAAKRIPPAIVVFPNGGLSGYRDVAEGKINVESMIIRELIPLVDKTYRTRSDRASRVLGGFSMGGGGAVRLALKYPERFGAAASWAGAFFKRPADNTFIPTFDIEGLATAKEKARLLLIVGYEDLTYAAHVPAIAALQAAKYPFTFHTIGSLGHELGRYYSLTGDEFIDFLAREFPPQSLP